MISRDREGFEEYRKDFKDLIIRRLTSGRTEDDRVIVPTSSLYVEALVGTHPLLEDFKLLHRALDVRKVQDRRATCRARDIRLAARALDGKTEDPDVDKNIMIEAKNTTVAVQPEA